MLVHSIFSKYQILNRTMTVKSTGSLKAQWGPLICYVEKVVPEPTLHPRMNRVPGRWVYPRSKVGEGHLEVSKGFPHYDTRTRVEGSVWDPLSVVHGRTFRLDAIWNEDSVPWNFSTIPTTVLGVYLDPSGVPHSIIWRTRLTYWRYGSSSKFKNRRSCYGTVYTSTKH